MDMIDIGSVLKLQDGSIAVVFGIIDGEALGVFYSVIVDGFTKEIDQSQIVKVIIGDIDK
jgi:hypothetical protein